jgi:hypothetical protein
MERGREGGRDRWMGKPVWSERQNFEEKLNQMPH